MKSYRWRLLLLVVLSALSIYALLPSFQFYNLPPDQRDAPQDPALKEMRSKALKLGLDLKGGMHLLLEIERAKLPPGTQPKDVIDRAMEILRNRIDQFGVAEPIIQRQGDDRILVQLPGLLDKERAVKLIGETAQLEFKLVKQAADSRQVLDRLNRLIAGRSADIPDSLLSDSTRVQNPLTDLFYNYPDMSRWGGAMILEDDFPKVQKMLAAVNVDSLLPRDTSIGFSSKSEILDPGHVGRIIWVMNRRAEMTGEAVQTAVSKPGLDPRDPTAWGVSMTLTNKGANVFRRVTGANVGRELAIVLDNKVQSAPVIRDRIPTGNAQITGHFGGTEAKDLAIVLRAGALPAPLRVIEERTVGPSLGRDSVSAGVRAGIVGALIVVVFMLVYYQGSGLVAVLMMLLNMFFLFAGLAALRGTLTMPGIAGLILTIGMSVDANILIFERIREELRSGKTVKVAMENGFDRAWRTIIDTHLTTLITALVLFRFGTGPIKGFAITLGLGLIANLYTAVFVARMIFDAVLARRSARTISI